MSSGFQRIFGICPLEIPAEPETEIKAAWMVGQP